MYVIKNNGQRRLGIPGRPALILNPGENATVDESQYNAMQVNRTFVRWVEAGVVLVNPADAPEPNAADLVDYAPKDQEALKPPPTVRADFDKREEQVLPQGVTGEGVELHHLGGGWWEVYVGGFKVTDKNLRKPAAELVAEEYK